MRDEGHEKWQERHSDLTDVADSPHHFNKLKEALPKVAEGILSSLKAAKKSGGRVPTWVQELSKVDPSVIAYVGLMCSFNGVLRQQTVTQVTQNIGEMVEKELLRDRKSVV